MYHFIKNNILAAALAVCAAPACAATVTATYTGTIGTGNSASNFFEVGEDLAGVAFMLVFVYDTLIGVDSSPSFDQVYGGSQEVTPGHEVSPMLSATLTINAIEFSQSPAQFGQATLWNDAVTSYAYHFAGSIYSATTGESFLAASVSRDDGSILGDILAAQEIGGPGLAGSLFQEDQGYFSVDTQTYGTLVVDNLSITVAAVPLPGSLPLFAAALLGLGAMRRRTKTKAD